ncbi:TPA: type 1 fimbrial protein, partial [Escherichia coli]|nr:type 1 fimbrial protein [Escherichia coli]
KYLKLTDSGVASGTVNSSLVMRVAQD